MSVAIDAELARRLVAAQFPRWSDLTVTPVEPGGWDNRTFRLGDDLAIRMPAKAIYAAAIAKEQVWLPRLAPHLPLPIPAPLGLGAPGEGYPWPWSVNGWLPGEPASEPSVALARDIAGLLAALQVCDAQGGPAAGDHSFHRGGDLTVYDGETRDSIERLGGWVDAVRVMEVWGAALATRWERPPVWVHGDVAPGNLLVANGRLSAVIDFGQTCVGDPACDLAIAWTFFQGPARAAFRAARPLDAATWARGRGWALWKALKVWAALPDANPAGAADCPRIVADLVAEHRALGG